MFSEAMNSECLVELWGLNIWWSYGFGCLVELWVLDIWWSYGLWMLSGAMGFGCLVFKK